jgi:hypothetical protein
MPAIDALCRVRRAGRERTAPRTYQGLFSRLERELQKIPMAQESLRASQEYLGPATIACVEGFVLNLVRRNVKLISPCKASDRWPLGYYLHGEATFTDAADLRRIMIAMIDEHMPTEVPDHRPLAFRADLRHRHTADGLLLFTNHAALRVGDKAQAEPYAELGDLIASGHLAPREIAERMLSRRGWLPGKTYATLDHLFTGGLLDEEPAALNELVHIGGGAG